MLGRNDFGASNPKIVTDRPEAGPYDLILRFP